MYDHKNIRGAADPETLRGPSEFPGLHWFGQHRGPRVIEYGFDTSEERDAYVTYESRKGNPDLIYESHSPRVSLSYHFHRRDGRCGCSIHGGEDDSLSFQHTELSTACNRARWAASQCLGVQL